MKIIDIVASNVRGLGAIQVANSLLPALERVAADRIGTIWLPIDGELAQYRGTLDPHHYKNIRRIMPNSFSRLAECLYPANHYGVHANLLILGDLPLRHKGRQIVFVHRSHLLESVQAGSIGSTLTLWLSRKILQFNAPHVTRFIVQTNPMREGLLRTLPQIPDIDVQIIPQPAPDWLISDLFTRKSRVDGTGPFRLFYPSAVYPHKNHELLFRYAQDLVGQPKSVDIRLTCDAPALGADNEFISFLGRLSPKQMRAEYEKADALLFPSLEESYGLPIVEAISIGIPIVCADRPYSRALCGESAIYFDPTDTKSLACAVSDLRQRLALGWWPDWKQQKNRFPKDWDTVASSMIEAFGTGNIV